MSFIFIPVDFSDNTVIACRYAAHLSSVTGAELILFHSFDDQFLYSEGSLSTGFDTGVMITEDIIQDFFNQKKKNLEELKTKLLEDHPELIISTRLETGNPEYQIFNMVDELNPLMIVMSSIGMGKKIPFTGSVCSKVIDRVKVPVLAIPLMEAFKPIRSVLYTTNFDRADMEALGMIKKLLKSMPYFLHCLHLELGEPAGDSDMKMKGLIDTLKMENADMQVEGDVIDCQHPADVIDTYCQVKEIDLISFIPHKRNIFLKIFSSDLTKHDLFHASLPILALQPNN